MAQLLKDGLIIENNWQLLETGAQQLPSGYILLSLSQWHSFEAQIKQHHGALGVWLEGGAEIDAVAKSLAQLPLIAIHFATFMDGRGFSLARLLRERYHYSGELRATGQFIRDQLYLLKRCGFNAFQFEAATDLTAASRSLADFSDAYQIASDQPVPLFRRRQ